MSKGGLYIHIPFCASRCNYCNFYSSVQNQKAYDEYTTALCDALLQNKVRFSVPFDTLYIGGGTPTVLGAENLEKIILSAKPYLTKNPEITVECNPADSLFKTFSTLCSVGVNRLSIGVQSANEKELKTLGRRHRNADVIRTVNDARSAGIDNISLDLMLGIPYQTLETLKESLDFLLGLNPTHISAYILKIEPDTPFGRAEKLPSLPDGDTVALMYEETAKILKENGFLHYEISNFAKPDFRSKHNIKYWQDADYWGVGPSAYSYIGGRRFYYENDIQKFIENPVEIFDENGGGRFEYVMLSLRTSDGVNLKEYETRFGEFPKSAVKRAENLALHGIAEVTPEKISLTEKGFLVSNSAILKILGDDFD